MKKIILFMLCMLCLTACNNTEPIEPDIVVTPEPVAREDIFADIGVADSSTEQSEVQHTDYIMYDILEEDYTGITLSNFIKKVVPEGEEYTLGIVPLDGDTIYTLESGDYIEYSFTLAKDYGNWNIETLLETCGDKKIDGITDVVDDFKLWECFYIPSDVNTELIFLNSAEQVGFVDVDVYCNPEYPLAEDLVGMNVDKAKDYLKALGVGDLTYTNMLMFEMLDGTYRSYVDSTYSVLSADDFYIVFTESFDEFNVATIDSAMCLIGLENEPFESDGYLYVDDESCLVTLGEFIRRFKETYPDGYTDTSFSFEAEEPEKPVPTPAPKKEEPVTPPADDGGDDFMSQLIEMGIIIDDSDTGSGDLKDMSGSFE